MTNILQSLGFGSANSIQTAAFILRVTLGALFLAHAWLKVFVFTPAGAAQYFASLGVPGFVAYLTIAAEVLGGLALILGVQTSLVSLLLIPVLLGAAILAHGPNGFWFTNANGGWEYPAFWAVALLVQALLGGGLLAVTRG
ncbi:DoxX family protein [Salipiger sp. H15]|uniref:DoxX family protein n=1 Tax=Alloyangia sp. H15 TaxID=3029062 RepID=A0AAU8ADS7_9RHOB